MISTKNNDYQQLKIFLSDHKIVNFEGEIPTCSFKQTPAITANQFYFNYIQWVKTYFDSCHRDPAFRERWLAVTGSWDNKIVVDIGCGPGNLYATLQGNPQLLIGIDVAEGSLKMAEKIGYTPFLADAHDLPLRSEFADIVTLNAALHHCEDMNRVLTEAARLVRPGGMLVIDHDPQLSAWDYRGIGLWLYKIRLSIIYRWFLKSLDIPKTERLTALATEIHHKPGAGVTKELFWQTLKPLGFQVEIYPHNNAIGAAALQGKYGNPPHWRYRVGQLLSGINPYSESSALSLMCVATRPQKISPKPR
ncbi:MAG: class I SAM-dependent methyltransferase [Cyanobacteria bacterium P01_G01_bin.39]